jgi:putative SOS response-associated peptidase YedK
LTALSPSGLWDDRERPEGSIFSCTPTDPNELAAPIHDRMAVIPPRPAYDQWLDSEVKDPREPQPPLMPHNDETEAYPIGIRVNSPANVRAA